MNLTRLPKRAFFPLTLVNRSAVGVAVGLVASVNICSWGSVSADEVHLKNGSRLIDVTVKEIEKNGQSEFHISSEEGLDLVLPSSAVRRVEKADEVLAEYYRRKLAAADTVDDHWELAEYCVENRLREEREFHLWQIVRLDPEHGAARRGLRQSKIDGRWVTTEQVRREQGYVRFEGKWMLPAEVELEKARAAAEQEIIVWRKKIENWSDSLGKRRHAEAIAGISGIQDPAAIPAIIERLTEAQTSAEKRLWIEALEQINHPAIAGPLSTFLLQENDDDLRELSLQIVEKHKSLASLRFFMGNLNPATSSPVTINRAARALEVLGDSQAVRSLVEAVVTEHKIVLDPGSSGNGQKMDLGFQANGSGGFSFGNDKPKEITRRSENSSVVAALHTLTGNNFGYDQEQWRQWFVEENSHPEVNLRRRNVE